MRGNKSPAPPVSTAPRGGELNPQRLNDENLLYVRYCYDMIIMHTDKEKCGVALNKYMNAIKKLGLFLHEMKNMTYSDKFWTSKSKGPYEWCEENVPWVGFVGYEINRSGEIRVRKKLIKNPRRRAAGY
jgi:hypothetical protein